MKTSHSKNTLPARHPLAQAVALVLGLGVSSAQAVTFNVTSNADSGAGSLRQAVADANTAPGADDIAFDPGLGTITLISGQIDITETLTISGPAAGQTISGNNASRIFEVDVHNQPLTLENLTLTQGYTSGHGGAISALSDVTLTNSTLSDNSAGGSGGGLAVIESNVTLTDSIVTGNRSAGTHVLSGGGGIMSSYYGSASLTRCTVSGNQAAGAGGGINVSGGPLELTDSIVSGNRTVGEIGNGGGLYLSGSSGLILTNSIVSDNSTMGGFARGGGIKVDYGSATLTNSTVSGNRTMGQIAHGGGLWLYGDPHTLINTTVSGNRTYGELAHGGGIVIAASDATLHNSTITDNHATTGAGGIEFRAWDRDRTLTLSSTVLAANSGPDDNIELSFLVNGPHVGSYILDVSSSLFGDDAAEINGINNNNIFTDDADLARLADNGCAIPAGDPSSAACVRTHGLLSSSPALNSGDNPLALTTDQRGSGFPRVLDNVTDIGAFEGIVALPDKIGVYRPDARRFYLDSNGNGVWDGAPTDATYRFGIAGKPISGDWNGNGADKIGIYGGEDDEDDAQRFYLDLNGNGVWDGTPIDAIYQFGIAGKPIIGDWNGDGRDDIGIYRSSKRRFYLDLNGNGVWDGTPTDASYRFGIAGKPIIGNWDGDGADEIGIFNAQRQQFHLDLNGNGVWDGTPIDAIYQFGIAGKPIIGDWSGDGTDKIGVYRSSASRFYFDFNGNGAWDDTPTDTTTVFRIRGDDDDDETEAVIGKW